MEEQWYYIADRQRIGPVSINELRKAVASGHIHAEDQIYRSGDSDWIQADTVDGLFQTSTVSAARNISSFVKTPLGAGVGLGSLVLVICIAIIFTNYGNTDTYSNLDEKQSPPTNVNDDTPSQLEAAKVNSQDALSIASKTPKSFEETPSSAADKGSGQPSSLSPQTIPKTSTNNPGSSDGTNIDISTCILHGSDVSRIEDIFTVGSDGVIRCNGTKGILYTKEEYSDFTLSLEWRFPKDGTLTKQGSGIMLRSEPMPNIEVQLGKGDAGALWVFTKFVQLDSSSTHIAQNGHLRRPLVDAERPVGEWNRFEITFQQDKVEVRLNGVLVNRGWNASRRAGRIGLVSQGSDVEFRNIKIAQLAIKD